MSSERAEQRGKYNKGRKSFFRIGWFRVFPSCLSPYLLLPTGLRTHLPGTPHDTNKEDNIPFLRPVNSTTQARRRNNAASLVEGNEAGRVGGANTGAAVLDGSVRVVGEKKKRSKG